MVSEKKTRYRNQTATGRDMQWTRIILPPIIHPTRTRAQTRKMRANDVKQPDTAISWHFTVDDSVVYQHLPLDENGWHAGDGTNGTGNGN